MSKYQPKKSLPMQPQKAPAEIKRLRKEEIRRLARKDALEWVMERLSTDTYITVAIIRAELDRLEREAPDAKRVEVQRAKMISEWAVELATVGHRDDAIDFLAGRHCISNCEWDGWAMGITPQEVERAVRAEIERIYPDIAPEDVIRRRETGDWE